MKKYFLISLLLGCVSTLFAQTTSTPQTQREVAEEVEVLSRISIKGIRASDNLGFEIKNADDSKRWTISSSYAEDLLRFSAEEDKNILVLSNNGKVGIGTVQPDNELTVNGIIHAIELRVDLDVPAPDYVFEKNYPLPSLEEIDAYIQANKHLPSIPSAAEMQANGLNIKEMNLALLKKIEEMTLYMIDLKKKNDALTETVLEMRVLLEKFSTNATNTHK